MPALRPALASAGAVVPRQAHRTAGYHLWKRLLPRPARLRLPHPHHVPGVGGRHGPAARQHHTERRGAGLRCRSPHCCLRLIDCHARRMVPARLGSGCMPFVALSYAWGSAPTSLPPQSQMPSSASGDDLLPSLLPDTIEDAIKVTKKLRYRFLWVDRYCICQDDPADKARQIPLMGLIYGLVQVTLIAAAETDPSYGLPGVGRRRRKPQPRATVAGGRTLLWDLGDPKKPIGKAAWSTRGWNYQEALLSRRRLAFSDRQVYFECGTMYCCEASDVPLRITHKTEILHLVYLYPLHTVGRNAHDFTQRVSEYSKRRLSNPVDVLDGLQGILRFLE